MGLFRWTGLEMCPPCPSRVELLICNSSLLAPTFLGYPSINCQFCLEHVTGAGSYYCCSQLQSWSGCNLRLDFPMTKAVDSMWCTDCSEVRAHSIAWHTCIGQMLELVTLGFKAWSPFDLHTSHFVGVRARSPTGVKEYQVRCHPIIACHTQQLQDLLASPCWSTL